MSTIIPEEGRVYKITKAGGGAVYAKYLGVTQHRPSQRPGSHTLSRYAFENLRTGRTLIVKSRLKIKAGPLDPASI